MNPGTQIRHQGRLGEVLSRDILTDFVTIELYGPEPFRERRKVVPVSEVETVDTIPAPPIQEVATKLSRSEARRLAMVRVAKLGLEGVETWPR